MSPVEHEADTTMLEAALAYARLGWWVFPLHTPRTARICSCRKQDCPNNGKHPRTAHGLSDASTDEAVITRWWGQWPEANIGVSTGPSGLVVIDIDPRHGGSESLDALILTHGRGLLDTVTAETGGGGTHLVYRAPAGARVGNLTSSEKLPGVLGPGIDVRGDGGYIVAAPSLHRSLDYYAWLTEAGPFERTPADLPYGIFEALTERPLITTDRDHAPVSAAAVLRGVPEGQRDWELFRLAAKLRYADVPRDWAETLAVAAADACQPPFSREQALRKVASAYERYAAGTGAVVAPATELVESVNPETGEVVTELPGRVLIDPVLRNGLPATEWAIEGALARGRIHLCYGEPESGKTIIALAWMRHVIEAGGTAVFIDEESGVASVVRLLEAMGVEAIDHGLHYYPFLGLTLDDTESLLKFVDGLRPTLVVFDSLTDMLAGAGLDENSGIEVTRWMNDVAQAIARRPYAPAVVLVDHITKDAANTKYAVASRAKKAKADVLWHVVKEEDFDQERTAGVDLVRHKNRPGVMPKKLRYVVGGRNGRLVCEPFDSSQHEIRTLHPTAQAMLAELVEKHPEEVAPGVLAMLLSVSVETVRRHANALISAGYIYRAGITQQTRYGVVDPEALPTVGKALPTCGQAVSPQDLPTPPPLLEGGVGKSGTVGKGEKSQEDRDVWNP